MKSCPVCATVFAGRIGQICCSKQCNLKARAKKRNITRTNAYHAADGMKLCDSCGEAKSLDLFDRTPKGTPRAACHECRREWRKNNKERIRRMEGATPRVQITAEAKAKKEAKAVAAKAKAELAANFIGPRKPSRRDRRGDAVYFAWRIANEPAFYAKQLDRAQDYKARTRTGYKSSTLGWTQMPPDVIASKHLMYLISKQLKRSKDNEKH